MAGPKVAKKLVDTVAEVASKGRSKAEEILAGIKTAEEAVSLKGPEREADLRALDEVHGPREQRAKDMGFGDKTLYHGTPTPDFAEFDKNKNIFLTDNPNYADEYTVSMGGRADKFLNEPNKDTPSILPLNMRTNRHVDLTTSSGQADYLKYLESKGYAAGDEAYDDAVNAFKSNNSWTLENSLDTDYYLQSKKATSLETLEDGNTNIRVNNPNQIRSTNAAFDPRFKDSPLLLAGQGAAALGLGAAAFGGSEAEASPASAVQKAVKAATKTDAQKIIDSIKTAEQAVALKGPEREAYLKALDEVQGPTETRGRDVMGTNTYDKMVEAHAKQDEKLKKLQDAFGVSFDAGELGSKKNPEGYYARAKAPHYGDIGGTEFVFGGRGLEPNDMLSDFETVDISKVRKDFRRQGVATELYRQIEKEAGLPVRPSSSQSKDGERLWGNIEDIRAFGNSRVPGAAFDTRFKDSPLLLAGAGAIPALSPSEQEKVGQYIQKPKAQQILETMEAQRDALPQDAAFSQLAGTGTFRDTGRQSEGIGESLDSMFGVPARQALLELGQKNLNKDAAKRIAESFGTDPMQKPTGVDVALEMTDNPYLGTAIATASDMAGMPVGTAAPLGIRASVKAVKGLKPDQVQDLRRLVEKVKKAKAAGEPIQLAPGMAKDSQFGIKQFIANKQNEIDAVQAAAQQRRATELDVASKLPPNGLIKPSDIAD